MLTGMAKAGSKGWGRTHVHKISKLNEQSIVTFEFN